jgi:hypothetical protein
MSEWDYELVEEEVIVRHPCGHTVRWQLWPGRSASDVGFLRTENCPCCGAGWGDPAEWARRNGRPCPEWPDHVGFGGLGVAHCHSPLQACGDVRRRHHLGLATKGGPHG